MDLLTEDLVGYAAKFLVRPSSKRIWWTINTARWKLFQHRARCYRPREDILVKDYPPNLIKMVYIKKLFDVPFMDKLTQLDLHKLSIDQLELTLPNLVELSLRKIAGVTIKLHLANLTRLDAIFIQVQAYDIISPKLLRLKALDSNITAITNVVPALTSLTELTLSGGVELQQVHLDVSQHSRLRTLHFHPRAADSTLKVNANLFSLVTTANVNIAHLTNLIHLNVGRKALRAGLPVAPKLQTALLQANPDGSCPIPTGCNLKVIKVPNGHIKGYHESLSEVRMMTIGSVDVAYVSLIKLCVAEYTPAIIRLTNLTKLIVKHNPSELDLSNLTRLRELHLRNSILMYPPKLKVLVLADSLADTANLSSLRELTFHKTGKFFVPPSIATNLVRLVVKGSCQMETVDLTYFTRLRCLSYFPAYTEMLFPTSLRQLHIRCCNPKQIAAIVKLTQLTDLSIRMPPVGEERKKVLLFSQLGTLTNLRSFKITMTTWNAYVGV